MKRSRAVELTLVASVAALFLQCDRRPTRYCVDENQNVSDDNNCQPGYYSGTNSPVFAGHPYYHWYYGGARGAVANGTHLSGGSVTVPHEGFVTSRAGGSVRGIIGHAGSVASGHGGS